MDILVVWTERQCVRGPLVACTTTIGLAYAAPLKCGDPIATTKPVPSSNAATEVAVEVLVNSVHFVSWFFEKYIVQSLIARVEVARIFA